MAMPQPVLSIEGLKSFSSTVEVVGVGRVRLPRGDAQESEVELLVAERTKDRRFEVGQPSVSVWIGCGQLDLATVGSRWTEGVREPLFPGEVWTADVELSGEEVLGTPVPEENWRFVPTKQIANSPCYRLSLSRHEGFPQWGKPPAQAIVPRIEIARALFGVNSRFLLEMFDGIYDARVARDRGTFDHARSGVLDDGTVRIFCPRRLRRREAYLVAARLGDPVIRQSHDRFSQSLVTDREFTRHRSAFARPPYPFSGTSRLSFNGRWMLRETSGQPERMLLITRVLGLSFPVPFQRVEMHWPATTREGSEKLPPLVGRIRLDRLRRISMTTGRAPGGGQVAQDVAGGDVALPGEADVEIIAIPTVVEVRPEADKAGQDTRDEAPGSTAGRETGGDPDVKAVIIRRGRAAPTPDQVKKVDAQVRHALAKTASALAAAAIANGWSVRFVVNGASTIGAGGGTAFSCFDKILQAEVETDQGFVVIVDAGSVAGDKRSLGILYREDGSNATDEDHARIRAHTFKNAGHWRSRRVAEGATPAVDEVLGFKVRAAWRPNKVWGDGTAYVKLLKARIVGVLGSGD